MPNFQLLTKFFRRISLRCFWLFAIVIVFPSTLHAADIQAQLDSNNGSSGFSVQSSTPSEVARIDSSGNLTTHGKAGIDMTAPAYTMDVNGDIGDSSASELILQDQGGSVVTMNNTLDSGSGEAIFAGNVGIRLSNPGVALDVEGSVRSTGLTINEATPIGGYVLTAIDSNGDTTWSAPGNITGAPWSQLGTNVYTSGGNNVGIGTSSPQGALVVTNGNVGIGTWAPTAALTVGAGANAFTVSNGGAITNATGITTIGGYAQTGAGINSLTGNVGLGTTTPQGSLVIFNGNVGIGIQAPGVALDVSGSVRSTGLTVNEATPVGGYVLTAIDSNGDTTWSAPGNITGAPWLLSGTNIYTPSGSDNVGIGTSSPQGALVVTNGNVGIGTWAPSAALTVGAGANAFTVSNGGAITNATGITTIGGYAQTGVGINSLTGNVGLGTTTPQGSLVVTNGNVGIGTWAPAGAMVEGKTITIAKSQKHRREIRRKNFVSN